MKIVQTDKAPGGSQLYSQAVICGSLVFCSGQIALSPETGEICGTTVTEQAEQVIKNLKAVLEEAGSSITRAVKCTCFLSDMGDFAAFNEVYAKHFTSRPARSTFAVKELPRSVLVEIEVIAEI
ncbi:MAG: RidA family protein [Treponema sp.]|nr:RidA family protein [Treponema sp.]